jgi:hypothetical protein
MNRVKTLGAFLLLLISFGCSKQEASPSLETALDALLRFHVETGYRSAELPCIVVGEKSIAYKGEAQVLERFGLKLSKTRYSPNPQNQIYEFKGDWETMRNDLEVNITRWEGGSSYLDTYNMKVINGEWKIDWIGGRIGCSFED